MHFVQEIVPYSKVEVFPVDWNGRADGANVENFDDRQ